MNSAGTSPTRDRRLARARRVASQAFVVGAAMAVGNLMSYLLSVTASRRLGPEQFGVLGALLGLLVVGYVAALTLQMVTTRRVAVATTPEDRNAAALTRTALIASLGLGVVALLLTPPLVHFLHLSSPVPVLLVAATCVPMTWSGYLTGLVLGRERFGLVALNVLLLAVGKVGGGLVGLVAGGDVDAVMWGTTVGTVLGVGAATVMTGQFLVAPGPGAGDSPTREAAHVGHALLALYVFTNLDVLLARHHLSARDAGLYAAGAIVTKIAFWLPQFIAVVALPRLADRRRRSLALNGSLLATAVIGLVATLGSAAAGGLVVALIAGPEYEELSSFVWLFAAEGGVFAIAQLLLYGRLSRQDRTAVVAVWVAVVGLAAAVAAFGHQSPEAVVTCALVVGALLATAGLVGLRLDRRSALAAGPDRGTSSAFPADVSS